MLSRSFLAAALIAAACASAGCDRAEALPNYSGSSCDELAVGFGQAFDQAAVELTSRSYDNEFEEYEAFEAMKLAHLNRMVEIGQENGIKTCDVDEFADIVEEQLSAEFKERVPPLRVVGGGVPDVTYEEWEREFRRDNLEFFLTGR